MPAVLLCPAPPRSGRPVGCHVHGSISETSYSSGGGEARGAGSRNIRWRCQSDPGGGASEGCRAGVL